MSDDRKTQCQDCGKVWDESQLKELGRHRTWIEPGDEMPAGECPDCGAAAMLVRPAIPVSEKLVTLLNALQFLLDSIETMKCDAPELSDMDEAMGVEYPESEKDCWYGSFSIGHLGGDTDLFISWPGLQVTADEVAKALDAYIPESEGGP